MESEDTSVPVAGQQSEYVATEASALVSAQRESVGAEEGAPVKVQQTEPMGAEESTQTPIELPEPMGAEGATALAQQPHPISAGQDTPMAAQEPEPSVLEAVGSGRSRSAPPTMEMQPVHLSPLPPESIPGSSAGSSSDWISNATDVTWSASSLDGIIADTYNGHPHTSGSDHGNGASDSVPSSSTVRQNTSSQMESEPPLSTHGTSEHVATLNQHPHGSNSWTAHIGHTDAGVTTSSSSMSLNFSTSSNSGSDPTKHSVLSLRSSSISDSDDEEMDDVASVTSLMNLVDAFSDYFDDVEQQQTEEYIIFVIKGYVDLASTSMADLRIIATKVFDNFDVAQPSGSNNSLDNGVEWSELCASLERRLQAVRDYARSASDDTTGEAIAELIIQEYKAEMRMAESGMLSDERSGSAIQAASACHETEVPESGVLPDEVSSDSQLKSGGVQKVPLEGLPAEKTDSLGQTASGSMEQETLAQLRVAMKISSVFKGTKQASKSRASSISSYISSSSSSSSEEDHREYALLSHYEQIYPETERQRKVRKSRQAAAVFKIFSMVEARVCGMRTMNWVMLSCLKTVIPIVNQSLQANRMAQRAISEAAAFRSAGRSADYIAAVTESAIAASQCAETAVREIEEAVQLHKLVVDCLKLAERALFNIKTETCDGIDLIRHLVADVEIVELQVSQVCKTYLDKLKDKYYPDTGNSFVLPASGVIHDAVLSMAFENSGDGPCDVLQALMWASQSSLNALEMTLKGLEDFSIAKLTLPYRFKK
ncbi:serine-rich adhesin for platelets-like [Schistocerca gregaria]|uniref:serine-rich adhesin for platelets-like n=1 Tax=Schistocerca gregaria TaxID=7010 RepID=UPI00211E7464|nr:serine-rich adhesin for platelets-like [Schistocerca gregaria]XP_049851840.1 serine-rich adhesin for platelets-like [Schistocerca gregaria]